MTTTALAPFTVRDNLALAAIINAAQRQDKVVYTRTTDGEDTELRGVARGFFTDAESHRPFNTASDDIRTAYLRITLSTGFEGFYSVADLMAAEKKRKFVAYDWS